MNTNRSIYAKVFAPEKLKNRYPNPAKYIPVEDDFKLVVFAETMESLTGTPAGIVDASIADAGFDLTGENGLTGDQLTAAVNQLLSIPEDNWIAIEYQTTKEQTRWLYANHPAFIQLTSGEAV